MIVMNNRLPTEHVCTLLRAHTCILTICETRRLTPAVSFWGRGLHVGKPLSLAGSVRRKADRKREMV